MLFCSAHLLPSPSRRQPACGWAGAGRGWRHGAVRAPPAAAGSPGPLPDLPDLSNDLAGFNPYGDLVRGKRFVCTECGKCCTGPGEVWVSLEEECPAIAGFLGIRLDRFLAEYTRPDPERPGWHLLNKRAEGSQDCVFLEGGTKCSIHPVWPLQCKTYPWWPHLMNPAAWVNERMTMCEGISHETAPEVDAQEKGELLRLATEQQAELQAAARMALAEQQRRRSAEQGGREQA